MIKNYNIKIFCVAVLSKVPELESCSKPVKDLEPYLGRDYMQLRSQHD